MILCHCNVITRSEIEAIIDELMEKDRYRVITPGLVYHLLGKRGKCCGCFPQVVDVIGSRMDQNRAKMPYTEPQVPQKNGENS